MENGLVLSSCRVRNAETLLNTDELGQTKVVDFFFFLRDQDTPRWRTGSLSVVTHALVFLVAVVSREREGT